jgi:nucleoside-diphosphate-sugar epimerase
MVLVTGATGLVGGVLARVLSAANTELNLDMRLVAHGRDREKCAAFVRKYGIEFIGGDIREPLLADGVAGRLDYIVHCAAITKSSEMAAKPVDVIATAADGTKNMLELARKQHCRNFLFLSSMEVYGQTDLREVSEDDLGYLDLSNPRSSYPENKRFCEMLCVAHAVQYRPACEDRAAGADIRRGYLKGRHAGVRAICPKPRWRERIYSSTRRAGHAGIIATSSMRCVGC